MAKRVKTERWCDRCGDNLSLVGYVTCYRLSNKTWIRGLGWLRSRDKDLCRSCGGDFDAFMSGHAIRSKERGLDV